MHWTLYSDYSYYCTS